MSSFNTISAILRGAWLIQPEFAAGMLPWVHSLLSHSPNLSVPRSGAAENERPFFIFPKTMQRYEWQQRDENDRLVRVIPPDGSVAVIPVNGAITKYDGGCGEPGSLQRQALVLEIDSRPEISGALYIYDTPGGQVSGTSSLANTIRNAKKRSVAYVADGIAASAGMWFLAASAEAYVSLPTDQVGSIGAYSTLIDFTGWFEQQGLKLHEIYAPQSTDKNAGYRAAIRGNDDLVKEDLSVIVDSFINFVADRSPRARANIEKWNTGKMFYAAEAKKYGLIEGILPLQQAIARVSTLNKSTAKPNSSTKNTTMSFEKTLSAAKAEKFDLVEGGFLLQEQDLNNIESAFETQFSDLTRTNTDLQQKVVTLEASNAASEKKVKELQAKVATMEKADATTFSTPTTAADDPGNSQPDKYAALREAAFPRR